MKIAVITQGDPNNRAGFFNNVHERILHLKNEENVQVDAYLLNYARKFKRERPDCLTVDGIPYNIFYVTITTLRYLASFKFKLIPYPGYCVVERYVDYFKDYDLLSVHSIGAMQIAEKVKEEYGIPYVITWHGSDIHTNPQRNAKLMALTKKVMENADRNFFVSKALMSASESICNSDNKEVLYSGVSDYFREYSLSEKTILKKRYEIENKKVVAFLGNVISIKNVLSLPDIFKLVDEENPGGVQFWIIGDGNLYEELNNGLIDKGVDFKMWGKQGPQIIPDLLNCVDVLVLPSYNEGLPLVTEEALQCGVNVVGSDVGGISEVIGVENVFALGENFIHNMANRISEILQRDEKPKPLSELFRWDICTNRELECYNQIIKNKV